LQLDTRTIRELAVRLHERAGERGQDRSSRALDPASPEIQALVRRVAPMGEALYLMMIADGESSPSELSSLREAIQTLTAGMLSDDALDGMLDVYATSVESEGVDARLMRVGAQLAADPEDAEMTVALCAALALADGSVENDETTTFVTLTEWLGLSPARVEKLLGR